MTPLDAAHAEMVRDGTEAARRTFLTRLVQAELFLWLKSDDATQPEVLDAEQGPLALVFNTEDRLAALSDGVPVTHGTLFGRAVIAALRAEGLGLGLNLTAEKNAFVLDAAGVDWLAEMVAVRPRLISGCLGELSGPRNVSPEMLGALDLALSASVGTAQGAHLVAHKGQLVLVVSGASMQGEDALSRACAEALAIAGFDVDEVALTFVPEGAPVLMQISSFAIGFELSALEVPSAPLAPGRDPARPPKLT